MGRVLIDIRIVRVVKYSVHFLFMRKESENLLKQAESDLKNADLLFVNKAYKEIDLESFVKQLNKKYPLEFVVLFGSRARGDELKSSDYDLLIVSNWFQGNAIQRMDSILEIWHGNVSLEPICFTMGEFEANLGTYNTIVWEALKDGKVLFGTRKFGKYKKRFLEAVAKKEIEIRKTIHFNVAPEIIFS
jgi:hypothetical protein